VGVGNFHRGKTFGHLTVAALLFLSTALPQIQYERGSLMDFIGGGPPGNQLPPGSYDNFVSHVSEGIARPGYNDYGPEWLDVQTNGFGNYRYIPVDQQGYAPTLAAWRQIFGLLLNGDTTSVATMLADSISSWHYRLVIFTDTLYNRAFWLLREDLDSSFFDPNTDNPLDDVRGSFRNGWGCFIYNPESTRPFVIVEVPHPCDDFIAPYVALRLFLETDAGAYFISGAGREVRWTGDGNYDNNKSLSDPSRNYNTVFETAHEVFCDSLMHYGPHSPLVLHMHSFDNLRHVGSHSVIISAGWDAGYANKPVRDVTSAHKDFVNFTPEYPITAGLFGFHPAVHVTDYYQVHYEGDFFYHGALDSFPVPHAVELLGPSTGVQMNYLRRFFPPWHVYEPWVQVECDEVPQLFEDLNWSLDSLYTGDYPVTWRWFQTLLDYYEPFVQAVNTYLEDWEMNPDHQPPPRIGGFQASFTAGDFVELHWQPVDDTNFKTYRILISETGVPFAPLEWDFSDDPAMGDMRSDHTRIETLPNNLPLELTIVAEDWFGNVSQVSDTVRNYALEEDSLVLAHRPLGAFPLVAWPPKVAVVNQGGLQLDSLWVVVWRQGRDTLRGALRPYADRHWLGIFPWPGSELQVGDTLYYYFEGKDFLHPDELKFFPINNFFTCVASAGGSQLFHQNFELVDGGLQDTTFDGYTYWQWGTPSNTPEPHSGTRVWGTNLGGNYANLSYATLTSPVYDLNGYGRVVFSFFHWFQMEASASYPNRAYDGGNLEVSLDGGLTWQLFEPLGGYTHIVQQNTNTMDGEPVFSGSSNGWQRAIFDLTPYVNDSVRFRWRFGSDQSVTARGWYLDDLALTDSLNLAPPTVPTLISPPDSSVLEAQAFFLLWEEAQDPDAGTTCSYLLRISSEGDSLQIDTWWPYYFLNLPDLGWSFIQPRDFIWEAAAVSQGDTTWCEHPFHLRIPPRSFYPISPFHLLEPRGDTVLWDSSGILRFQWERARDNDVGVHLVHDLFLIHRGDTTQVSVTDTSWVVSLDTLFGDRTVTGMYTWWVVARDETESRRSEEIFHFRFAPPLGTERPVRFHISVPYPNPFNSELIMRFELPSPSEVDIAIYDLQGREVKVLNKKMLSAGRHAIKWRGRDTSGRFVASGVYFIRIRTGTVVLVFKALYLK